MEAVVAGHSGGPAVPKAGLGTAWGWWTLAALETPSMVAVWDTVQGAGQGSDTVALLCGPAQATVGSN